MLDVYIWLKREQTCFNMEANDIHLHHSLSMYLFFTLQNEEIVYL